MFIVQLQDMVDPGAVGYIAGRSQIHSRRSTVTIDSKIQQMATDLTKLAAYYNDDKQYQVALTIQGVVVAVNDVLNQIAEIGETDDPWPARDEDRQ